MSAWTRRIGLDFELPCLILPMLALSHRHELGHELQTSSSAGICCAEEEVRGLEHRLGTAHPRVGKAWLQLSRAYQQAGGEANVAKSEQALLRYAVLCRHNACAATVDHYESPVTSAILAA